MRQSLRTSLRKQAAATTSPSAEDSQPSQSTTTDGPSPAKKARTTKTAGRAAVGPVSTGKRLKKWIFTEIVNHKWEGDEIQLEVRWQGTDETSWEPEANIHRDAKSSLVQYWRKQPGGRPLNPRDEELFNIYAFKGVKTDSKGERLILVEWVGWARATWEPEAAIMTAAPAALQAYLSKKSNK